ncbi:MAG: hypothetical protein ACKVUT_14890 [Gaiella sp.]
MNGFSARKVAVGRFDVSSEARSGDPAGVSPDARKLQLFALDTELAMGGGVR